MESIDKLVKDLTTKDAAKLTLSLFKDDAIVFLNKVKIELRILATDLKLIMIDLALIFKDASIKTLKKMAKVIKKGAKKIFGITKTFLGKVWKKVNGKIPYKIVKKVELNE